MSDTPKPRLIMEGTVLPIQQHIKDNIAAAMARVRTTRDAKVTTELPKDYFVWEQAIGLRCPAVFIIGDTVDMALDKGQNFIASKNTVYVSILVEDRTADYLTQKCWVYQDALFEILDQAIVPDVENNIKNFVKVTKIEFSNTFQMKAQNPGAMKNPFRKEVMLTLEVEHMEAR